MRLHRFYLEKPITEETFDVPDEDLAHQWSNVFRYNVGSQVILFDGSGTDFLCIITSLRNLGATVSVVKKITKKESDARQVWLCLGITKKDNFELVVQKSTEIGVAHIVPVLAERTEKKNINMVRLQKIIIEASEQSGRSRLLQVHPVTTLSDLLSSSLLPQEKILLHFGGQLLKDYVVEKSSSKLAVFVGPEGGWSDREVREFTSNGIPIISLGAPILRAETASIAAASLLLL